MTKFSVLTTALSDYCWKFEKGVIQIYCKIIGEGFPVLIIHGFYADHRSLFNSMENILSELPYKRFYIDLPGMGKSEAEKNINSMDDLLNYLLDFIEQNINGKFIIAAHSFGAYIAAGIAKFMPERISGLVMICPCIIPDRKERDLPKHEIEFGGFSSKTREFDLFRKDFVIHTETNFKRYLAEIYEAILITDNVFLKKIRLKGYGFSFEVYDDFYEFKTLFLLARNDSRVGYKDCLKIYENYKNASLHIFENCGHNPQIEKNIEFDLLVSNFFAAMPANA